MSRPTLTVVGKGGVPDASAEEVARAEDFGRRLVELVKSGGQYFVVLDGEEQEAGYFGDLLEIAALSEEVARQMKMMALGLE